jgi:conjugal transfer pilus assembly protein TraK
VLLGVFAVGLLTSADAIADGLPDGAPPPADGAAANHVRKALKARVRDPLAADASIAVQNTPALEINLPGVLKLEGAQRDLVDSKRVRKISWTNGPSQTVWVSATQPNRIQLPFANPRVVSTGEVLVDKRAASNNVYVTFQEGVTTPTQMWLEPAGESSASIGLELVPKSIPAQTIVVVDDTVAGTANRAELAGTDNEYLTHLQALLEQAALGASPEGYSVADLQLPPIAVNGLAIEGMRRLSGRADDIYVYAVTNPGTTDVQVHEREFDGDDVKAVSIVPRPYLHPGEKAIVAILAAKRQGH